MSWFLYILTSLTFSYFVAKSIENYFLYIFVFIITFLLTPSLIEVDSKNYAPAFFSFLYSIVFEQDLNFRLLRSIFLSVPIALLILFIGMSVKKRLF